MVINESTYSPKEAWSFINYLDTGNITDNSIASVQKLTAGKDKIPSRARRKALKGDIVFSTVRPNQRHFGLLREVPDNFLVSTGFAVIRGKGKIADTGYLYWFLSQPRIVEQLHSIAENSTSTYPAIRPSDIEDLEITIPPLPEQRRIAHMLGTLDDKIELNRRMNETLDEMARAIFKDWFVDFGPVRAKMEGRDAYLPDHIWKLFPDTLADSELGQIPHGWQVGRIDDIATVSSGKRPRDRTAVATSDHQVPLWGGNGPMGFVQDSLVDHPIVLTGRVGTLGSVFRIATPCWPSDNTLIFKAKEEYMLEYLFFQLARVDYSSLNRGSTQPLVAQSDLKAQPICIPTNADLKRFHNIADKLYERVDWHEKESRTLAAMRDTLLPKLVSGEVRINT